MTGQVGVELLLVPQCPHADAARTLLSRSLDELGLNVTVVERVGDFPSPTITVGGRDVMTGREVTAGVSACRLDVPTGPRVRHALQEATRPVLAGSSNDAEEYPPQLAVGVTRDRIATVSPAARRLHQAILRGFATTGVAPDRAGLAGALDSDDDLTALLGELHGHDVIRLDDHGGIRAAYPFSGVPTAHRVAIDGGPSVYAMCAIDALGIADMLGRNVTITSADPQSVQPVGVRIAEGIAQWTPDTAVVFVGSDTTATPASDVCCPPASDDEPCIAPAADRCCAVMNFFADPVSAQRWRATRPDVSGVILSQGQALRLGVDIFGRLLEEQP